MGKPPLLPNRRIRLRRLGVALGVITFGAVFFVTGHPAHEVGPHAARVLALGPLSPPAASLSQQVTVDRPAGQVVLGGGAIDASGRLDVSLTDTRDDDPGWSVVVTGSGASVAVSPFVSSHTAAFIDSSGTTYAQRVAPGPTVLTPASDGGAWTAVLASAPAHHGLGIASLGAAVRVASGPAPTLTLTVI